jgi:hypothetical protein
LKSLRDFEFNPVQSYTDLIRIILLLCWSLNSLMVAKPSKIYFGFCSSEHSVLLIRRTGIFRVALLLSCQSAL